MKTLRISLATLAMLGLAISASAQIRIENAWVRATVPQQQATGAFMKITSSETVRLVAVTTTVAKTNEIHEMKMEGGIMKMRAHPNGLEIRANTTLELKSGSYHLMMMELDKAVKAGDIVPLKLEFTDAKGKNKIIMVDAKASFKNPYTP
jgi:copper(I)-binding protein